MQSEAQDFVKLAKWEDRGFYAMQQSRERAQRQLHKLTCRAAVALNRPAAAVLGGASKAMGLPDLAAPDDIAGLPAKAPGAGQAILLVQVWTALFCIKISPIMT